VSAVPPLRQVHDAIWAALEGQPNFATLVPALNRIKFYGGLNQPLPDGAVPARFPSVRVVQRAWQTGVSDDSAHRTLMFTLEIQLSTGEQKDDRLSDLSWFVLCAIEKWCETLESGNLTWQNSVNFIEDVRMLQGEAEMEHELSQGPLYWSAVWRGEVHCRFLYSDMIAAGGSGT